MGKESGGSREEEEEEEEDEEEEDEDEEDEDEEEDPGERKNTRATVRCVRAQEHTGHSAIRASARTHEP